MQPFDPNHNPETRRTGIGKLPVLLGLFCTTALALGLWVRDRQQSDAFDIERSHMNANMNQAMNQSKLEIQALNQRLDDMSAAEARARAERVKPAPVRRAAGAKARRKPAAPVIANDPRVDKLQGQLSDTQQELARTRDELSGKIDSTRSDLGNSLAQTRDEFNKKHDEIAGRLDSTRDDLNGSIAKTHDEIVALRKRGEQNIYEFRLDKSKQFQRVGPISVSLRNTNPKHKTYDVAMMVEDNQLDKKHINLYEPVWINLSDRPQAVQLVVNHVDKTQISGYVSEPKYKKSELASATEKPAPQKTAQLETR